MNEVLEQLQISALAHAAHGDADLVFSICDVADFEPGRQQDIAATIIGISRDDTPDPMIVLEAVSKMGKPMVDFFTTYVAVGRYGTPTFCAEKVREAANRRRVTASVTRAYQALTEASTPVEDVVAALGQDLEVAEANIASGIGTIDFEDIMAVPDDYRPWVIPKMLRTNERLIITGPEGGGKSILISQLALGASMGLNTMSLGIDVHEPLRVLMLDVENDKLQIKANMHKVYPHLRELSGGVKPQIEWVDVRDIDLSDPVERQKVIRLAKERMPQLMYMGSLYKLAPEGEKVDQAFTVISRTVDRIRAETGTSVLMEAHTGHGLNNDRNGAMRPYGSSMWLRWPEFGMAMIPQRGKPVRIKHWRGARSDDRTWPAGLKRGNVIPWEPISEDEYDALYGLD